MKKTLSKKPMRIHCVVAVFFLLIFASHSAVVNGTVKEDWPDWKDGKRELKVYISNNGEFKPAVRKAMKTWNDANSDPNSPSKNNWQFVETDKESEADISIDEEEPPPGAEGYTHVTWVCKPDGSPDYIESAKAQIKPNIPEQARDEAIMHELGHCMRLDHTDAIEDVMGENAPSRTPSKTDKEEAKASDEDPPCPLAASTNALSGQSKNVALTPKPGSGIDLSGVIDVEIVSLTGPELHVDPDSISWDPSAITATFEVADTAAHNEVYQAHLVYPDSTADFTGVLTITEDDPPAGKYPHAVAGNDTTVEAGTPVIFDGRNSYHDEPTIFFSGGWLIKNPLAEEGFGQFDDYGSLVLHAGEYVAVLQVRDYYGQVSQDTMIVTVTGCDIACEALTPVFCRGKDFYFVLSVYNNSGGNVSGSLTFSGYAGYDCNPGNLLVAIPRSRNYAPGTTEQYYFFQVPNAAAPGQYSTSIDGTLDPGGYDVSCCMNVDIIQCGPFRTGENTEWDLVDVGREEVEAALPVIPSLAQNYPNPFNEATNISYTLAEAGKVRLKVYDISGRLVEALVDEVQDAGSYTVTWDASEVSSGVYFYKLSAGDYTLTKKMNLLK